MRYRDDGVGFDPAILEGMGARADTFGLFNVRERCEYLGGRVGFASRLGGGVDFAVELPVKVGSKREGAHAGQDPRR